MSDNIEHFTDWFLANMPPLWAMPYGKAVWTIEEVTSVLLYRKDAFQVQCFIVPGHYVIPEHTHPNVDSIEIYVGGQIKFSHSGKFVIQDEHLASADTNGLCRMRGTRIRVRPHDLHGGAFGEHGGVFLSSQQWLHGVTPHCVACDYTGPVLGPTHLASVIAGEPVLTEHKIAASLE